MSRNQGLMLFGNPITHPLNLILLGNTAIYLLQYVANQQLIFRFALTPDFVLSGSLWQVFTYGFLHAVEIIPFHLLVNMYGMYMLGNFIIPVIGKANFVLLYFLSQLGAGIFVVLSAVANQVVFSSFGIYLPVLESMTNQTIGASGALFGLLALFGIFYPNAQLILFIFPVRAKNAVWVSLLIGYVISQFGNGSISNTCHLGGALSALLLYRIFKNRLQITVPNLPGMSWEEEVNQEVSRPRPTKSPTVEDLFSDQIRANERLLADINGFSDKKRTIEYLSVRQVEDANICPPPTYNPQDKICLRCEWLPNCALRKVQE